MLTIADTGFSVTKSGLIGELGTGTIVLAGFKSYMDPLLAGPERYETCGLGFHSAFLVADEVTVTSKHEDEPQRHTWTSRATGTFTVSTDDGEHARRLAAQVFACG